MMVCSFVCVGESNSEKQLVAVRWATESLFQDHLGPPQTMNAETTDTPTLNTPPLPTNTPHQLH
jgi:hypothetical protein